ncbi:MAG TPA: PQQ-dependent sugar dehydrogenase [Polyangiaceae bacterium]|nr:PQQ-dependent sugar dehydrogenase [Polyangiaceae bacterium]
MHRPQSAVTRTSGALWLLALACGSDSTQLVPAGARPDAAQTSAAGAPPEPSADVPHEPDAPSAPGPLRDEAPPIAAAAGAGGAANATTETPSDVAAGGGTGNASGGGASSERDAGTGPDAATTGGSDEPLPPLVAGLSLQARSSPFLSMPPQAALTLRGWDMTDVFPNLTFTLATFVMQEPSTGRMFVAERPGRIWAFEKRDDVTERTLVLDITGQCLGNGDRGLVGFAFHPEFGRADSPNRGYLYVHYPHIDPATERPFPADAITHSRLSRFTLDLNTLQADPASELVLIDQFDESPLHLGGALFFHPDDGYLYLTVGDEGTACSRSGNCGRIDKDLFSGVLRIDVDPNVDDDSHAIPRQPEAGVTANYTIPNDNPFVGRPNALEEFYALGVRSPHRMTHDALDDIIWLGDVGNLTREELDVVTPGANLQWNSHEGFLEYRAPTPATVGVWTDPVLDFSRYEARCIVGGYVYRGSRFPELYGRYVFGDFSYNSLWALDYTWDGERAEALDNRLLATAVSGRRGTLTSLGVDTDGELYMTSLDRGPLKTLTFREQASTNLPAQLSGTGVFDDVAALVPAATLLPYAVNNPLWSDGASKRRWVALPEGGTVGFVDAGAWTFPAGTVFVKHFELALDERAPEQRRRLETRVLVAGADGVYYGASYKWNAEGTDAELLLESQTEAIEVTRPDGSTRRQEYFYPGPTDCSTCHNARAGYVLGVRAAQLNGEMVYPATGQRANQLWTWSELGLFDRRLEENEVRALPALAALDDESRSVEDRVRSYWDSNCSMCHGTIPGMRATWDARFQTPLGSQGVVLGPSVGTEGAFVVVPGDVEASLLVERDRTTDPNRRMPPLGRTQTDAAYIALLERWVRSLPSAGSTP